MAKYRIIEHAGGVYIQIGVHFLWRYWWRYVKVHYQSEVRPTRKNFSSVADARKQIDSWLEAEAAQDLPPRVTEYPTALAAS